MKTMITAAALVILATTSAHAGSTAAYSASASAKSGGYSSSNSNVNGVSERYTYAGSATQSEAGVVITRRNQGLGQSGTVKTRSAETFASSNTENWSGSEVSGVRGNGYSASTARGNGRANADASWGHAGGGNYSGDFVYAPTGTVNVDNSTPNRYRFNTNVDAPGINYNVTITLN